MQAQEGFPSYYVRSNGIVNDESVFDFSFVYLFDNSEEQDIGVIACDEYIKKYISDPYTASEISA